MNTGQRTAAIVNLMGANDGEFEQMLVKYRDVGLFLDLLIECHERNNLKRESVVRKHIHKLIDSIRLG